MNTDISYLLVWNGDVDYSGKRKTDYLIRGVVLEMYAKNTLDCETYQCIASDAYSATQCAEVTSKRSIMF